jgi:hypothetical protein
MGGSDMQHSLELEIRDRLSAYLAGETLVYQIKLDWAEFSNGDRSEKDLRDIIM